MIAAGRLTLNLDLIHMPTAAIGHVVAHELFTGLSIITDRRFGENWQKSQVGSVRWFGSCGLLTGKWNATIWPCTMFACQPVPARPSREAERSETQNPAWPDARDDLEREQGLAREF
jgi:hypothetical protein